MEINFKWIRIGPTKVLFPITFLVPESTANEEHYVNPKSAFRPAPRKQTNPKQETQGSKVIPLTRHRKKRNSDEHP